LRGEESAQMIVELPIDDQRLTLGRGEGCDLRLSWDRNTSRVHAELERIGGVWTVVDDGLSSNGTLVNGARIGSRQRLRDRDVLQLGETVIVFREPSEEDPSQTRVASLFRAPSLSDAQVRVLHALCRPYKSAHEFTTPATNQQISTELFLSVEATKTHLRALFAKFEVEDLPQNQKRTRLVERAFQSGSVSHRDL
jgi:pSer/pThr/pTyr-binding forkhead associated (FHA) protein